MSVQYQCQLPLGSLPINLVLVGNRQQAGVVFVKTQPFVSAIFDTTNDGEYIDAAFYKDDFVIFGGDDDGETLEEFAYNTIYNYKEIPAMLRWLKRQNLQEPENIFYG